LTACVVANPDSIYDNPSTGKDSGFQREDMNNLPAEIAQWVKSQRTTHHATEKVFGGRRYILASYGEKSTGGYTISIDDVVYHQNKITITVKHSDPAPGTNVIQALTYPQDLISIANVDLPIEYIATGDQSQIGQDQ
jgi:hypothetical protein